jgi:hypothetical protein
LTLSFVAHHRNTFNAFHSYDNPVVNDAADRLDANQTTNMITLHGHSFGRSDYSLNVQLTQYGCTTTTWLADTSLLCKLRPGYEAEEVPFSIIQQSAKICRNCLPEERLIKCGNGSPGYCWICESCSPGLWRDCLPSEYITGECFPCQNEGFLVGERYYKDMDGTADSRCIPCAICGGPNQDGSEFEARRCTKEANTQCTACQPCPAPKLRVGCAGETGGACTIIAPGVTNIFASATAVLNGETISQREHVTAGPIVMKMTGDYVGISLVLSGYTSLMFPDEVINLSISVINVSDAMIKASKSILLEGRNIGLQNAIRRISESVTGARRATTNVSTDETKLSLNMVSDVVHCSPAGLQLQPPATMTLKLNTAAIAASSYQKELSIYAWDIDENMWKLIESRSGYLNVSSRTIGFQVSNFSTFVVMMPVVVTSPGESDLVIPAVLITAAVLGAMFVCLCWFQRDKILKKAGFGASEHKIDPFEFPKLRNFENYEYAPEAQTSRMQFSDDSTLTSFKGQQSLSNYEVQEGYAHNSAYYDLGYPPSTEPILDLAGVGIRIPQTEFTQPILDEDEAQLRMPGIFGPRDPKLSSQFRVPGAKDARLYHSVIVPIMQSTRVSPPSSSPPKSQSTSPGADRARSPSIEFSISTPRRRFSDLEIHVATSRRASPASRRDSMTDHNGNEDDKIAGHKILQVATDVKNQPGKWEFSFAPAIRRDKSPPGIWDSEGVGQYSSLTGSKPVTSSDWQMVVDASDYSTPVQATKIRPSPSGVSSVSRLNITPGAAAAGLRQHSSGQRQLQVPQLRQTGSPAIRLDKSPPGIWDSEGVGQYSSLTGSKPVTSSDLQMVVDASDYSTPVQAAKIRPSPSGASSVSRLNMPGAAAAGLRQHSSGQRQLQVPQLRQTGTLRRVHSYSDSSQDSDLEIVEYDDYSHFAKDREVVEYEDDNNNHVHSNAEVRNTRREMLRRADDYNNKQSHVSRLHASPPVSRANSVSRPTSPKPGRAHSPAIEIPATAPLRKFSDREISIGTPREGTSPSERRVVSAERDRYAIGRTATEVTGTKRQIASDHQNRRATQTVRQGRSPAGLRWEVAVPLRPYRSPSPSAWWASRAGGVPSVIRLNTAPGAAATGLRQHRSGEPQSYVTQPRQTGALRRARNYLDSSQDSDLEIVEYDDYSRSMSSGLAVSGPARPANLSDDSPCYGVRRVESTVVSPDFAAADLRRETSGQLPGVSAANMRNRSSHLYQPWAQSNHQRTSALQRYRDSDESDDGNSGNSGTPSDGLLTREFEC